MLHPNATTAPRNPSSPASPCPGPIATGPLRSQRHRAAAPLTPSPGRGLSRSLPCLSQTSCRTGKRPSASGGRCSSQRRSPAPAAPPCTSARRWLGVGVGLDQWSHKSSRAHRRRIGDLGCFRRGSSVSANRAYYHTGSTTQCLQRPPCVRKPARVQTHGTART